MAGDWLAQGRKCERTASAVLGAYLTGVLTRLTGRPGGLQRQNTGSDPGTRSSSLWELGRVHLSEPQFSYQLSESDNNGADFWGLLCG